MLNFNSVMLGTKQVEVMGKFYEAVLGRPADMPEGGFGWTIGSCFLMIMEHSEVADTTQEPARIMLNFETSEVKVEFDRMKEIAGVTVVKEPYEIGGGWVATLADPDGNYLQLVTPWDELATQ